MKIKAIAEQLRQKSPEELVRLRNKLNYFIKYYSPSAPELIPHQVQLNPDNAPTSYQDSSRGRLRVYSDMLSCPKCMQVLVQDKFISTFFRCPRCVYSIDISKLPAPKPQGGETMAQNRTLTDVQASAKAELLKVPEWVMPDMRDIARTPVARSEMFVDTNDMTRGRDKDNLQTQYPFAQTKARCPKCGSVMVMFFGAASYADSAGKQGDNIYRCLQCDSLFTEEEWKREQTRQQMAQRPVGETDIPDFSPSGEGQQGAIEKPVTKPFWSPKQTIDDDNLTLKRWITFDYNPIIDYVLSFIRRYKFDLITGINDKERKEIRRNVTDGFKFGWSIGRLADNINDSLGDYDKSETIARTETLIIANQARLNRYDDEGVSKVRWSVAHDQKLCEECEERGKKEFYLLAEAKKLKRHPNCRCSFIPYIR